MISYYEPSKIFDHLMLHTERILHPAYTVYFDCYKAPFTIKHMIMRKWRHFTLLFYCPVHNLAYKWQS